LARNAARAGRAAGATTQNNPVITSAEVKHQAHVAPITNGSKKVR
jgi:hypothetical protein